ncbi:MAG: murein biosynthesis integral membrane protein MurJ [bacterium]
MRRHKEIARAAGVIGTSTLVSRLMGYIRDMVMSSLFGAGMVTDAYIAAFRIPNYLIRLFGEGTLNASFVPVFTETLNQKGREKAWELANVVITAIFTILALFVVLGMIFTPGVVRVITPGFTKDPLQFNLTVLLTRIIFPVAIFVGLSAASMGILNSLNHFGSPAIAPSFFNLMIILCAIFLSPHLSIPIMSLAIGVLLGGLLQISVQVPFLISKGFKFRYRLNLAHQGLRKIFGLMVPGVIGQSVLQINLFVGNLLASLLPTGSITYLFFADRLVQFPLAVFGFSAATAMLPTLSVHASNKNIPEMVETLSKAIRMVLFLMIPSMVGLLVLSTPIVNTLFQRGSFGAAATQGTSAALMFYSLGLWAFAEVRIVAQTFYATQDTWTPMKVAALSLLVNLLLSIILMRYLQHAGLALANSLSSMLNISVLIWILRRRIGPLQGRKILSSVIKIFSASLAMGLFAYYGAYHGVESALWLSSGHTARKIFYLGRGILMGAGSYAMMCITFRVEEFQSTWKWIFKRTASSNGKVL